MVSSKFVLLSLIGVVYGRSNDWSKPCHSGVCFYDLPSSAGAASGTLKIWGSSSAITDITAAAGWEILDCQKDALAQDIRLVCTDESKCAHLYKSIGAVGKVVRLPEQCGQNAFARISRAWVPEDQSIPENIAKRLVKRDGVQPEVKALHVNTDFSAGDASRTGAVNFAIQAANVPGADRVFTSPSSRGLEKRLFGFVRNAVNAVTNLNNLSIDKTKTLAPLNVSKSFNILDSTLSCPPLEASLKLDVTADVNAVAAIGVAAEGTIIPPKINDFAVTATLTADLNGAINMTGRLTGAIDSGKINLLTVAIPGLDFPGILTIGPSFKIDAQANANLDVNADLNVGINYKIDGATLVFPPSSKKADAQGGSFKLGDTPLTLSVSPSTKATGTVVAHLIPSLNLGISALAGVADANIFLALDASATMDLGLEGQATATTTLNRARAIDPVDPDVNSNLPGVTAESPINGGSLSRITGRSAALRRQATAAGNTFGGCVDILAGLDVNAGANANFFGLFDKSTQVSLFKKNFQLLKKCFGSQAARRELRFTRSLGHSSPSTGLPTLVKRLQCTASDSPALESLVDQLISAASVLQIA